MRSAERHTTNGPPARPFVTRRARGWTAWLVSGGLLVSCASCVQPRPTDQARSLSRRGHDDEAIEVLRRALAEDARDVPARRLLVRLLGATGDLPGARAQAEELSRIEGPDDPTAYIELGHALELSHRYDEALAAYDEAATAAPRSAAGPREGGLRAARWGEAAQAAPRLAEAVRRGATDVETWHALGLCRLKLGDFDGAERAYRAGAAADPRAAECWLGLASVAIARGDPANALRAYDEVLVRRPRFAPAALGRVWALAMLGRRDEALRALIEAETMGAPKVHVARLRAMLAAPRGAAEGAGNVTAP